MLQRDDDRRAALVGAAVRALKGSGRGKAATALQDLADCLFAGAAVEDLAAYPPADLAAIATDAFAFSAQREPGRAKLRVVNPEPIDAAADSPLHGVTVIEAVNDDMPFLLSSTMAELTDRGLDVRLVLHPIVGVTRDDKGKRTAFHGAERAEPGVLRESVIHIQVARVDSDLARKELAQALERVYRDVRQCVADWRTMVGRLDEAIARFRETPPPIPVPEIAEAVQFLEWLRDDNFTFLGMRQYAYVGGAEEGRLERAEDIDGAGLGLLRDPDVKVLRRGREFVTYTPELRDFLMQPVPLIVTKANVKSTVHRRVYLDYVGVKTFDDQGALTGELRIVGLYTSTAYNRSVRSIPYLRRKADLVVTRAGFDPESHSGAALLNVLETFPRDELFQIDQATLEDWALAILQLGERPRIRVLHRADRFDRFVSVLVYVPRDRYDTEVRRAIGGYLAKAFQGRVSAFYPAYPEGSLARVHFIIGRHEGETPRPAQSVLEAEVARLSRTWDDGLKEALSARHDPVRAADLYARYRTVFPPAYQNVFQPGIAVDDATVLERLGKGRPRAIAFYDIVEDETRIGLKVFVLGRSMPLSERVPILENMGFKVIRERSFDLERATGEAAERIALHDMVIERADGARLDLGMIDDTLHAAFMAVVDGRAENDGYNALVVNAGIAWRDIALLRALSRYIRQIGVPYSQDYMWATLNKHPGLAERIVALFHARFSPRHTEEQRAKAETDIVSAIETALENVPSLDEDRIVRRFTGLVRAAKRTSYFQFDPHGQPKETIAIKFSPREIEGVPEPRPHAEIFVYAPRVEGVHLRFGKIARGGLRWSDRPQDFRTEVLGLVKAQQVKNAVIVPVGAKGGFVPKRAPLAEGREAVMADGVACYKLFVSSLLDITDNLAADGSVVPPDNVARHDDDDPYLVVAADKGTATFSDIANEISVSRGFWLGDAFASGGSAGYDHKKMGITARGAWEAVKRHFRETDVDIQTTPFTVVGVGDMSGDVFGNGMLLSEQIRLVAAFDHRDIFIDPEPDPATGFAERMRLFALARSSWRDYDAKLISAGGGVFSRADKKIALSPEARRALAFDRASATPAEIMQAILRAPADLLWFGGIGTYVRAAGETDAEVGDRANDAIRVAASELRVKVIGEGANLGMTQRARIEFATAGGRLNTDAIDNSAGVNSSDVEVNIKIALGPVVQAGALALPARNKLLAEMTDEVARLVLRNNYLQTLSLSLVEQSAAADLGFAVRLMRDLEERGMLDRAVETLPSDAQLSERAAHGRALTRPEYAVLLAYAKIDVYGRLLASAIPDDPYLGRELMRYFPAQLRDGFAEAIAGHRLRREIIATMLSNSVVNRGGPTFVGRLADETGAEVTEIVEAFALARDSFAMTALNEAVDALDARISGALQLELYGEVQRLLGESVAWFLRNVTLGRGLADTVGHYRGAVEAIAASLETTVPARFADQLGARRAELEKAGVPGELARSFAGLRWLARAPDIALVAETTGHDLPVVARIFYAIGDHFDLSALRAAARVLDAPDYYERLALSRTVDALLGVQRRMTADVLATGPDGGDAIAAWHAAKAPDSTRARRAVDEILQSQASLARLSVATSMLGDLVNG